MKFKHEQNYILNYESAVEALKTRPDDRDLQHQAVLSLARAGSLDFAIAEFKRFGLGDVNGHEDIMALDGRLSKDLYLRTAGEAALEHAKDAARKYEAAFEATRGFYSGINSATMALIADMRDQVIMDRVAAVEALLPPPENLTPEDHYFVEATRAECHLLKGDRIAAVNSLQSAVDFDPLNFSAHSTTLKQFQMIAKKRSMGTDWLNTFSPPRSTHFAGRIKIDLSEPKLEQLKIDLSDTMQKNDIGFGYGSLAAGYDIVIAEALLSEGAALHVVLPCSVDRFFEHSVQSFGEDWASRFQSCLAQSASLRILSPHAPWPDPQVNRLTGQFAMGQAILMGHSLSVDPRQVIVLGENSDISYTSRHALDWALTGRRQIFLNSGTKKEDALALGKKTNFPGLVYSSILTAPQRYDSSREALEAAIDLRKDSPKAKIALHIAIPGVENDPTALTILKHGAPQSVLLSEVFASLLAFSEGDRFDITYAGLIEGGSDHPLRCYAVNNG